MRGSGSFEHTWRGGLVALFVAAVPACLGAGPEQEMSTASLEGWCGGDAGGGLPLADELSEVLQDHPELDLVGGGAPAGSGAPALCLPAGLGACPWFASDPGLGSIVRGLFPSVVATSDVLSDGAGRRQFFRTANDDLIVRALLPAGSSQAEVIGWRLQRTTAPIGPGDGWPEPVECPARVVLRGNRGACSCGARADALVQHSFEPVEGTPPATPASREQLFSVVTRFVESSGVGDACKPACDMASRDAVSQTEERIAPHEAAQGRVLSVPGGSLREVVSVWRFPPVLGPVIEYRAAAEGL